MAPLELTGGDLLAWAVVPLASALLGSPPPARDEGLLRRIFDLVEELANDPSQFIQAWVDIEFVETLRSNLADVSAAVPYMGLQTKYFFEFQEAAAKRIAKDSSERSD
jgi:hypothetical protein